MKRWVKTTVVALLVFVLVVIGMLVFVAVEKEQKLTYGDSFDLCMQTITTIGFGNHYPHTAGGRVFCIFFAIIGIPLNFYLLKLVGQHILDGEKHLITKLESRVFHRNPRYLHEKCLLAGILLIMTLVFIGAGIQVSNSGWKFIDGVWAYVIIFTTVGFGDLIPHHDQKSKLNMVLFLPLYYTLGLCVVSSTVQAALGVVDSVKAVKSMFGYREVVNEREEGTGDQDGQL
ncbi:predicted protein [Nematostella vectensis]|uniref:Potassium channel domain-containing protein n=1 Tax=Nematostella vectensis TaxID=45351 RepID=A7RTG3_NEMVE|nr:potassium channel subfamily K member 15 [Nematostella vectensis]EDO45208.1 predicted protein [Nematostella vectensis]|eukprot:XP_001637271.1 predicted protein [Nematostella vectensis]